MKTREILELALSVKALIQVQYLNYASNQWTVSRKITARMVQFLSNDASVRKIRIEFEN